VPLQAGPVTYSFAPLENPRDSLPRALKIPRGTSCTASNEYFYVEARKNVTGGVVIHRVTDGSVDSSYLLDLTPATSSWTDAALPWGQAFFDAQSGVTITPSGSATAPKVSVAYAGGSSCTRAAPAMTYTPTGTVWTSAGAQVSYAVSVTNKDSCGCSATSFDTSAVVPTGWTSTAAHSASILPGASTSTSVVVSTVAGATPAFYPVTMRAANSSASTMTTSASSTVAISTALAVGVSTDKATYLMPKQGNTTVNAIISSTVTSSGAVVAGAAVTVVVSDPSGKKSTLSSTTASDGVARVTYSMRSKSAPKGIYNVTTTGKIGAVNGIGAVSFTVQ